MSYSAINNKSIKALIVFRENGNTDNIFVPILCDAIKTAGIDVRCSTEEFWKSDTPYDIIHFQWPEEVVGWNCDDPGIIPRLKERIQFFRSQGAHFVYTRHNIRPHYANEVISRAYDVIESESDMVVHMGYYSLNEFSGKYNDSRNVVIPHHIYQYTYKENISVERARQYLKLPQDSFIVTAFGKFRNREERKMVVGAFREWKAEKKLLLAPRLYSYSRFDKCGGNRLKQWASRAGYYVLLPLLNRLFKMRAGASDELIDSCDLPYYLAASDVIFIQRIDNLNSANIPLAFLFRKIAIGPDVGNIGELLNETGNPSFSPDSKADILRALEEARILASRDKGEDNYAYAMEHMTCEKTGKKYVGIYKELVHDNNKGNTQISIA